jgi:hypothetical protein
MNITTLRELRAANRADSRMDPIKMAGVIRAGAEDIGAWVWRRTNHRRALAPVCGSWPGWPECECACCEHDEPAVTTDGGGNPVCEACEDYTCDGDGEVVCGNDPRAETVSESCGAGGQTRTYVRLKPPEMPEERADGEYALYWETVGSDARVIARFASAGEASQAVAAKDWPRPGDHTNYLCGYSVRRLADGEWVHLEDEDGA